MLALDRWMLDRARLLQDEINDAYENYNFLQVYHRVYNFCESTLGGFYLDIIKDRQYTTQRDSLARRSCQTAMYHIAEALVRWIAPILSFTADEIWQHLPGEHGPTIFTETWYDRLPELSADAEMGREYWERMLQVKMAVNKCLEEARNQGMIKGSLSAEVTLYAEPGLAEQLGALGEELRFVLITSEARVAPLAEGGDGVDTEIPGLKAAVRAAAHAKCARCWHHRPDVGTYAQAPDLCGRCIENVEGAGEQRHYA
jgi:isoleucyl-tRNA synthetase